MMDKFDHKAHSWMGQGNRLVLKEPGTKTTIGKDVNGLTREQRLRIEEIKFMKDYPELFEGDVF